MKPLGGSGLDIKLVRVFSWQLFLALEHVHSLGFCHLDVKLDNIMVDEKNNCVKVISVIHCS